MMSFFLQACDAEKWIFQVSVGLKKMRELGCLTGTVFWLCVPCFELAGCVGASLMFLC